MHVQSTGLVVQVTEIKPAAASGRVIAATPHQLADTQHGGTTAASSASEHPVRQISLTEAHHVGSGDIYHTAVATEAMAEVHYATHAHPTSSSTQCCCSNINGDAPSCPAMCCDAHA